MGYAVVFPPLPNERYSVVYADPPWRYSSRQSSQGRWKNPNGAHDHYNTVSTKDLMKLDVARVANKSSVLFMWAVSPMLDEAMQLGSAWGFRFAAMAFVWNKIKRTVGFYTLPQVEVCLCFQRGETISPNIIPDQYVEGGRGRHSRKPDDVRKRIETMYPRQQKIELFSREPAKGWQSWGNEVGLTTTKEFALI